MFQIFFLQQYYIINHSCQTIISNYKEIRPMEPVHLKNNYEADQADQENKPLVYNSLNPLIPDI
jgi:hypothetical protein